MLCVFIIGSIADSGISESVGQEKTENLSKCLLEILCLIHLKLKLPYIILEVWVFLFGPC